MSSKWVRFGFVGLFIYVFISGLFLSYTYFYSQGPSASSASEPITFQLKDETEVFEFPAKAKELNLFYFGYTNCPDVCPLTLTYLTQAVKNLTIEDQANIQVFFISVDYDNDTAASVEKYAKAFNPLFHGFTGSKEQIDALIKQFHGSYIIEKNEKSYLGYSITHTDRVFFVNDDGKILHSVANVQSVESVAKEIHNHL